jgi:16S rRNA C1402 N4-methylase RsmH
MTRVLDLTCGGGGHSLAFLTYLRDAGLDNVEVIGVDLDDDSKEEATQRLQDFPNFRHWLGNFGDLKVSDLGGKGDFVLGDLGVSRCDDDPERSALPDLPFPMLALTSTLTQMQTQHYPTVVIR